MYIPKGTIFRSVGDPHCEDFIYVFDPENAHDNDIYTTVFADYLTSDKGPDQRYYTDYKTLKDLNVLPLDEGIDIFDRLMLIDECKSEHEYVRNCLIEHGVDATDPWFIFCRSFENPESYLMSMLFLQEVANRYDAMDDYNDNGFYNDVTTAMIIFNPTFNLLEISRSRI